MVVRRNFFGARARAATAADGTGKRRPGRPPVHAESWTKVTVVLFDRQITKLDGIVSTLRSTKGATVSRAQLIRAFVDAVGDAAVDLTTATSEADVRAVVLARLGGPSNQS